MPIFKVILMEQQIYRSTLLNYEENMAKTTLSGAHQFSAKTIITSNFGNMRFTLTTFATMEAPM